MKKSINTTVSMGPILRTIQLIPTTGSKLKRTIVRILLCFIMKSALGDEKVC
jgi:hypothetical protein